MHCAAESYNGVAAMEWLKSNGADVHARDKTGETPMHYAAINGGSQDAINSIHTAHLTAAVRSTVIDGIAVNKVDATLYSSWTQGVFKFDKMPLADICARLSKWYDVDFTFEGDSGSERFTGGTRKYVPLEDFLASIEQITNVSFRFDGGRVVVSPKR